MLGKRLGPVKWSACFLLAFGIMVVQAWGKNQGQIGDTANVTVPKKCCKNLFIIILTSCLLSDILHGKCFDFKQDV